MFMAYGTRNQRSIFYFDEPLMINNYYAHEILNKFTSLFSNMYKFVELFAVADVSALTAAQCLLSVVGRYGCVETIRSDRGGQFVSEVFQHLVKLMGSKQLLTIGYRPQGNGIVERVNAEVIRHLSAIVHARRIKNMWSIGLPMV
jgi:hypothetical protein